MDWAQSQEMKGYHQICFHFSSALSERCGPKCCPSRKRRTIPPSSAHNRSNSPLRLNTFPQQPLGGPVFRRFSNMWNKRIPAVHAEDGHRRRLEKRNSESWCFSRGTKSGQLKRDGPRMVPNSREFSGLPLFRSSGRRMFRGKQRRIFIPQSEIPHQTGKKKFRVVVFFPGYKVGAVSEKRRR